MPRIAADRLRPLVQDIFARVGCHDHEAARIAHYLVEANLVGHDSHGVIRVPTYVDWAEKDMVRPNQTLTILLQTEALAVVDGNYGFGQVIGEQAMELGIEMARRHGLAAVALRNSGHLGRIGDWPILAAKAGLASLHFVNTSGMGVLVAPFGGIDRRLSANPIAAGMPVAGGPPLILDISTSAIAEGKLKVAKNKGVTVPEGCIVDHEGRPTIDPRDFYASPPGALLPFGGHKGYALSVITEMFAGALTGNGCTHPSRSQRLLNGMFSILVDPERLPDEPHYAAEVARFIEYVKTSRRVPGCDEILMPGDVEERTRQQRLAEGIEIDDTTWKSIADTARRLGVTEID